MKRKTTIAKLSNNQPFSWSEDGADWLCITAGHFQGGFRLLKTRDRFNYVDERLYNIHTEVWVY